MSESTFWILWTILGYPSVIMAFIILEGKRNLTWGGIFISIFLSPLGIPFLLMAMLDQLFEEKRKKERK